MTPHEEVQFLRAKGNYEFLTDRTAFAIRVAEIIREEGIIIGVAGPVIDGPERYHGMIATLLTRVDGSDWEHDMHTQANFKVGATRARRVAAFPHWHPEGTAIDSYPHYCRFAGVDAHS